MLVLVVDNDVHDGELVAEKFGRRFSEYSGKPQSQYLVLASGDDDVSARAEVQRIYTLVHRHRLSRPAPIHRTHTPYSIYGVCVPIY